MFEWVQDLTNETSRVQKEKEAFIRKQKDLKAQNAEELLKLDEAKNRNTSLRKSLASALEKASDEEKAIVNDPIWLATRRENQRFNIELGLGLGLRFRNEMLSVEFDTLHPQSHPNPLTQTLIF